MNIKHLVLKAFDFQCFLCGICNVLYFSPTDGTSLVFIKLLPHILTDLLVILNNFSSPCVFCIQLKYFYAFILRPFSFIRWIWHISVQYNLRLTYFFCVFVVYITVLNFFYTDLSGFGQI